MNDSRGTSAEQIPLFGAIPPLRLQMPKPPRIHRARSTDPKSSHQAHERREASLGKQSAEILRLIRKHCARSAAALTAWEIAYAEHGNTREGDVLHRRIGRRAPDLAKVGFIRRGPIRVCSVEGGNAVTWCAI